MRSSESYMQSAASTPFLVADNGLPATAQPPRLPQSPTVVTTAVQQPVAADPAMQKPGSWNGYFDAIALLCFVLAALLLALWALKRRGKGFFSSTPAPMHVESRLALGPKKYLVVANIQGERLLLGVTENSISMIKNLPAEAHTAMGKKGGHGKKAPSEKTITMDENDSFDAFLNYQKPKE